ncbi:7373_t:CDS:2 [Diversispora eburnea]|uniref:mRNA stability protein n=1 Tax=Diversispora eburnea TaxID=1213867 RepID=A0A9N9F3I3_9GLOM|nr:7373_t:CDS:2 [Diversispora eburnea]
MLPAKNNKIDLNKLSEEERKLFRMYGKLPAGKDILSHKLKERKYFDSGDYALSKAGKTSGPVGVQHPSPETIPHANAIAATSHNSSPVKESSLVHEAEIEEKSGDPELNSNTKLSQNTSPQLSTTTTTTTTADSS